MIVRAYSFKSQELDRMECCVSKILVILIFYGDKFYDVSFPNKVMESSAVKKFLIAVY